MYSYLKIIFLIVLGIGLLINCSIEKPSTNSKSKPLNESIHSKVESNGIPEDIIAKLKNDYPNDDDYKESIAIVNHIKEDVLNVGWVQLSRAVILLANGDLNKMKEIVDSEYYGDPRDVIMRMMSIPGNKNDHGLTPFK